MQNYNVQSCPAAPTFGMPDFNPGFAAPARPLTPRHAGRVGLGSANFGRETDAATANLLLDHAHELGWRHIDTAAAYSAGKAESIIGAWLTSRKIDPATLCIATKVQPPYTAEALRASLEASLSRLGLSAVDVFYLHRWDAAALEVDALAALDELVRSGRARALGVSNITLEQLQRCHAVQRHHGFTPFTVVQNNHNFAVREADEALRAYCAQHGIAVVTFSPLGAGFLTGKHARGIAPGTRFEVAPAHGKIYFTPTSFRRLDDLLATANRRNIPPELLALAWALRQAGVACTLIGARRPDQLEQVARARSDTLDESVRALEAIESDRGS